MKKRRGFERDGCLAYGLPPLSGFADSEITSVVVPRKEDAMKLAKFLIATIALSAFSLVACNRPPERHEGPAEKAGEKIDKGLNKLGEKMEEGGEKLQDKTK